MQDLLDFILSKEDGVCEDEIKTNFPDLSKKETAKILSNLLKTKKIDIYGSGSSLVYKKPASSFDEERIIYQLIAETNGKGLWLRDIKMKSNIPQNLINKILQQMENKKIIKSIKSVKNNRKIYVLYSDKVCEDVTGGVWFNDGEIDDEFFNCVVKLVIKYLNDNYANEIYYKNFPSAEEIHKHIERCKISSVQLNLSDVESLLKVMVYDEYIQELETEVGTLYRLTKNPNSFVF
ncbi:hypothetical protein EDEG_00049 [Edhazardia aedis USNM 41457]|uniref:DNA-directed RNA polymerase III subunit RPC6 n=1 Tax=Edhazardia aedis (strain USNM 41457) TaxID=1003232 RepID=J9DS32_EDHAE|nr:hypothetical protein EDEG_00049 [Edhazardia aedis USNM 41457]|eukprot:EJW05385.1 hypothetical protein EDEG_00049 [Edhazardia aedis USNM 41457]